MKKIMLTIAFIVTLITTSFAEKDNIDAAVLDIFKVLIDNYGKAEWLKKDGFNKRTLMLRGREISAYYIAKHNIVGLSYRINVNDLPKEVLNSIRKKYSNCIISAALVFMDDNGDFKFYAVVKNSKRFTALKISSACKVSVMKKIPIRKYCCIFLPAHK